MSVCTSSCHPAKSASMSACEPGVVQGLHVDAADLDTYLLAQGSNFDHRCLRAGYTTGDLPIQPEVRDYLFKEWVKQKGHGFIGTR